ncbi:pimeloyl-ACP methyl ester carboxylesterase [Lutibacter oceani]|uniref:Pimeloyl-ACP methyl ester carboxylesterase n=1 Tax=Lutibacter oceani TaxID=1853311 RepID=A0A3D9RSP1_9FLAO|nr:alpha/beta fold hydrolase [Lutibacter oceani]REE79802.1 pimeloyl-ACP methyl ester carboxylesterase [Lutibacter oceani]
MRKRIKIIAKVIGIGLFLLLSVLIVLFYRFSTPKSDEKIKEDFSENNTSIYINYLAYKNFKYRVLTTQKEIDTSKATIVFVHGSVGSCLDFKKYMFDAELHSKANLISYDRIGYGEKLTGDVQESIAFETEMLEDLTKNLAGSKTILVGYSYGGSIVLASKKEYKKIILLAPAVYSKAEFMPWALNFYKWKLTNWLLPKVWKAASKEKISHKSDLIKFENNWNETPSKILSIHGNKDWIVPYENSLILNEKFSSPQFELLTLNGAGHGLVWTHFNEIKNSLMQQLN